MAFQSKPKNKKVLIPITENQDRLLQENFDGYADAMRFLTLICDTIGKEEVNYLIAKHVKELKDA